VIYPNQDKVLYISTSFLCRAKPGEPRVCDDESLEMRYFSLAELPELLEIDRRLIELSQSDDPRADFKSTTG